MAHRSLFLAAYDVADPRRLRLCLEAIKGYATGGQKSVYECYLTAAERTELIQQISKTLDPEHDRFLLVSLTPNARVYTLGVAVAPSNPEFFYLA